MADEAAGVTYPSNSNIAYSTGTPRMSTRFKSVLLTPSSWGSKNSRLTHGPPTRGFAVLFRGEFRMISLMNMIFWQLNNSRCLGYERHRCSRLTACDSITVKMSDPTGRAHRRIRLDEVGRSGPRG